MNLTRLNPSEVIRQLARNPDSDTGDDIVDASAAYVFPASAAACTIVSASADDAAAGTGARTVTINGLNANYARVTETATLTGAVAVNLTTQFLRVNSAFVASAGSGGVAAGNIQVLQGATVLAQITAAANQTLMGVYTVPADIYAFLAELRGLTDGTAVAEIALQYRTFGGVWRTLDTMLFAAAGNAAQRIEYAVWPRIEPRTDLRLRAVAGNNNLVVFAGFTLLQSFQPWVDG